MGQIEEKSKKRRKKESVQKAVLAAIGIAGVIAVTALAPNMFLALPGLMGRKRYALTFQAKTAASRLAIKGHVRFIEKNGKKWIEITDAGRHALSLEQEKARLDALHGKRWDKRYRLVMFDIPQKNKNTRDSVRRLLRECGFLRLQNSVWLFPYDCEELITLMKLNMRLGKDLLYAIVDSIENDGWIKKHFGLK